MSELTPSDVDRMEFQVQTFLAIIEDSGYRIGQDTARRLATDNLALVAALRASWARLQECEQESDRMVLDRLRAADSAHASAPQGQADAEPGGA